MSLNLLLLAIVAAVAFTLFDTKHAYAHLGAGIAAVLVASAIASLWTPRGSRTAVAAWALLIVGLVILGGGQLLESFGALAWENPAASNRLLGTPLVDRTLHSSAGILSFTSVPILALGVLLALLLQATARLRPGTLDRAG